MLLAGLLCQTVSAQNKRFSRADSLRGSLTPVRTCFDVLFYDLKVKFDINKHRIAGSNVIRFAAVQPFERMQIDLFGNMEIERILWHDQELNYMREANAVLVYFPKQFAVGERDAITIFYGGNPIEAKRPPWDGGFVWKTDSRGKPYISVACEGMGASMWYPLKDHLSDEPDSMHIALIVPTGLQAIANGNLRYTRELPGEFTEFNWAVTYPINSYNATFYIGDYVHLTDFYTNASGKHRLDYYVLPENTGIATQHFQQVKTMLACFEKYFGEYPFWRDGYALVETSYWGMEHQSAIAYGNGYQNNEFGFDFIIIHESGHEWFGNSLSVTDHGEMWIHEAFTTYTEAVYVEYTQGYEKALEYLAKQRERIVNREPILGPLHVNYRGWGDADMYYKGTWMLQSLRHTLSNDAKWFAVLKKFAERYRLRSLNTEDVILFFNTELGDDYTHIWNEYLRYAEIPVLEYKLEYVQEKAQPLQTAPLFKLFRRKTPEPVEETPIRMNLEFSYRWRTSQQDFRMPVEVRINDETLRLTPARRWQMVSRPIQGETSLEFNTRESLFDVEQTD